MLPFLLPGWAKKRDLSVLYTAIPDRAHLRMMGTRSLLMRWMTSAKRWWSCFSYESRRVTMFCRASLAISAASGMWLMARNVVASSSSALWY